MEVLKVILFASFVLSAEGAEPESDSTVESKDSRAGLLGTQKYLLLPKLTGKDGYSKLPNKDERSGRGHVESNCYCNLDLRTGRPTVSEALNPTGQDEVERLVIQLYRVKKNPDKIYVYIPDRKKQFSAPDLELGPHDLLQPVTSKPFRDLLTNNPHVLSKKLFPNIPDFSTKYVSYNAHEVLRYRERFINQFVRPKNPYVFLFESLVSYPGKLPAVFDKLSKDLYFYIKYRPEFLTDPSGAQLLDPLYSPTPAFPYHPDLPSHKLPKFDFPFGFTVMPDSAKYNNLISARPVDHPDFLTDLYPDLGPITPTFGADTFKPFLPTRPFTTDFGPSTLETFGTVHSNFPEKLKFETPAAKELLAFVKPTTGLDNFVVSTENEFLPSHESGQELLPDYFYPDLTPYQHELPSSVKNKPLKAYDLVRPNLPSYYPVPKQFDLPSTVDNFVVPSTVDNVVVPSTVDNFELPSTNDNFEVPSIVDNFVVPNTVDKNNPFKPSKLLNPYNPLRPLKPFKPYDTYPPDYYLPKLLPDRPSAVDNFVVPGTVDNFVVPGTVDNFELPGTVDNFVAPSSVDNFVVPGSVDNFVVPGSVDNFVVPGSIDNFVVPGTVDNFELPGSVDNFVVPGSVDNFVVPGSVDNFVVPGSVDNFVVPGTIDNFVVPGSVDNFVVPGSVDNFVVAGSVDNFVVPGSVDNFVVPGSVDNFVVPGSVDNFVVAGSVDNFALPGTVDNFVVPGSVDKFVVPGSVDNFVVPGSVDNFVVPGSVDNFELPSTVGTVDNFVVPCSDDNFELPSTVDNFVVPDTVDKNNPFKPSKTLMPYNPFSPLKPLKPYDTYPRDYYLPTLLPDRPSTVHNFVVPGTVDNFELPSTVDNKKTFKPYNPLKPYKPLMPFDNVQTYPPSYYHPTLLPERPSTVDKFEVPSTVDNFLVSGTFDKKNPFKPLYPGFNQNIFGYYGFDTNADKYQYDFLNTPPGQQLYIDTGKEYFGAFESQDGTDHELQEIDTNPEIIKGNHTFDNWVETELASFGSELLENVDYSTGYDIGAVKLRIQGVLKSHGILITKRGFLVTADGQLLDTHELKLRPILVGDAIGLGKLFSQDTKLKIPSHSYFLNILVTRGSNQVLGVVPVGKSNPFGLQNVQTQTPGAVKLVRPSRNDVSSEVSPGSVVRYTVTRPVVYQGQLLYNKPKYENYRYFLNGQTKPVYEFGSSKLSNGFLTPHFNAETQYNLGNNNFSIVSKGEIDGPKFKTNLFANIKNQELLNLLLGRKGNWESAKMNTPGRRGLGRGWSAELSERAATNEMDLTGLGVTSTQVRTPDNKLPAKQGPDEEKKDAENWETTKLETDIPDYSGSSASAELTESGVDSTDLEIPITELPPISSPDEAETDTTKWESTKMRSGSVESEESTESLPAFRIMGGAEAMQSGHPIKARGRSGQYSNLYLPRLL